MYTVQFSVLVFVSVNEPLCSVVNRPKAALLVNCKCHVPWQPLLRINCVECKNVGGLSQHSSLIISPRLRLFVCFVLLLSYGYECDRSVLLTSVGCL